MASSTNNLIKVKDTTKVRLDLFKSNKTYDTVISEMLLYFETTGITPQSNVMPPNIAAKEQASRVIEIVRGIEKSTNVRMKNIEQLLLSLVGKVKTPGDNPDEYMHISQVQELLERSRQLEQEARENREKAGKLQTDLEIARQEKGTSAVGCNTHKILEILERIDEVKKIPTFNDTVYEIDRNTLDMWVKRLKDELKK